MRPPVGPEMAPLIGVPAPGRADVLLLNALGVSASAVGNHELDKGPEAFVRTISPEQNFPGATFPYLAANMDFSGFPEANIDSSVTVLVGGESVGIIGAVAPMFPSITDTGRVQVRPASRSLEELTAEIQREVDALRDDDVNKIILLSHMQELSTEMALAQGLRGVDIIVAGGSNTLLADDDDTLWPGDTALDTYPLTFESPDGEAVLLLNTGGDYRYLGRLLVGFDSEGRIILSSLKKEENGAYNTAVESLPQGAIPMEKSGGRFRGPPKGHGDGGPSGDCPQRSPLGRPKGKGTNGGDQPRESDDLFCPVGGQESRTPSLGGPDERWGYPIGDP